jgi:hypothetical protein
MSNGTHITCYRLAQVVNAVLEQEGLETIEPQQIYQMKGKSFKTETVGTQELVRNDEAAAFVKKYVEGRKNKLSPSDFDVNTWLEENLPSEEPVEAA